MSSNLDGEILRCAQDDIKLDEERTGMTSNPFLSNALLSKGRTSLYHDRYNISRQSAADCREMLYLR